MIAPAIPVASFALTTLAQAIQSLYQMGKDLNEYVDKHIEDMKSSENPTISRTGRVLEGAKYGFGLGYVTPVIVLAVGQLLLGNSLAAVGTVASAAVLSNPIAMTCAAIGAIYYGWGALTDQEREEILDKLSAGFEVGIELIRSMVNFVVAKSSQLLSKENFEEIKKYITTAAGLFGRTLGDVTHKLTDIVSDGIDVVKTKTTTAIDKTSDVASDAYRAGSEITSKAFDGIKGTAGRVAEAVKDRVKKTDTPTLPE